jgi:hypothetical protein
MFGSPLKTADPVPNTRQESAQDRNSGGFFGLGHKSFSEKDLRHDEILALRPGIQNSGPPAPRWSGFDVVVLPMGLNGAGKKTELLHSANNLVQVRNT